MKKGMLMILTLALLTACNNGGEGEKNPIDSIEQRKDTLLKNIDSTTAAKTDSLEARKEALKETIDSSFEARKDSLKKQ
jgi:uncharacterized protein YcfL